MIYSNECDSKLLYKEVRIVNARNITAKFHIHTKKKSNKITKALGKSPEVSPKVKEQKMIITGKDGKTYPTVDACMEADEKFEKEQEEKALAETEKKNALSKHKKELADNIREAENKVSLALEEYEKVREDARKKVAEAQEEAKKMLKEVENKYSEASNERYEAIRNFNKEFGAYTTTYTGKQALEEYNRFSKSMSRFFDNIDKMFSFPFWY